MLRSRESRVSMPEARGKTRQSCYIIREQGYFPRRGKRRVVPPGFHQLIPGRGSVRQAQALGGDLGETGVDQGKGYGVPRKGSARSATARRQVAPARPHRPTSKSSRVKNVKKAPAKPAVAKQIETRSKGKAARGKPAALKVRQTSVSGAAKEAARPEAKRAPPRPAPRPQPAPVKAAAPALGTRMTVAVVQERETVPPVAASARPAGQPSSQAPSEGAARPHIGPPPRPPAPAEIFVEGDHVVYPTHGVGKVERIVIETIAGYQLELIHITFEENRMTLRVPVEKARSAGLRKLATRQLFEAALATLKGRARIKRTMWSRRAQEYEAKINSGDPLAIAEVVRDLHRNAGQPDQSFSERQIYEAAMDRLAAELAALDQTDKATAAEKLTVFLRTTH